MHAPALRAEGSSSLTMIAKHFSALSFCPYGAFALGDATEIVCHCLLVESKHGLVLVDTGMFAAVDFDKLRTLRLPLTFARIVPDRETTAARQIEKLGYRVSDVRHVVCTHLDLDHAGGLADFPHAEIHVMQREHDAAVARTTLTEKRRYLPAHFAHNPQWKTHEVTGESWNGFSAVRALAEDEPDLLLVPISGHSRGHAAVAVRTATGWLLHCGDAYFHPDEMTDVARAPFGLELVQRTFAIDNDARLANQKRLRELKANHADVRCFCAHSKHELAQLEGESR